MYCFSRVWNLIYWWRTRKETELKRGQWCRPTYSRPCRLYRMCRRASFTRIQSVCSFPTPPFSSVLYLYCIVSSTQTKCIAGWLVGRSKNTQSMRFIFPFHFYPLIIPSILPAVGLSSCVLHQWMTCDSCHSIVWDGVPHTEHFTHLRLRKNEWKIWLRVRNNEGKCM